MERVLPKILRGVIEDVYQTPFRMLGNFGKQQLNKLKRKVLNYIRCILVYDYIYKNQTIITKLIYIFFIPFFPEERAPTPFFFLVHFLFFLGTQSVHTGRRSMSVPCTSPSHGNGTHCLKNSTMLMSPFRKFVGGRKLTCYVIRTKISH